MRRAGSGVIPLKRWFSGGDMSDMYPTTFLDEQVQLTARGIIRSHGDDAFAEATKQINECNARGDFSTAESWVIVCRRIRELQAE